VLTAQSIRQNPHHDALPDFRNVGVVVRILLFVNAGALLAAAVNARDPADWLNRFALTAAWMEPAVIAAMIVLTIASAWLMRLPYRAGLPIACALALTASMAMFLIQNVIMGGGGLGGEALGSSWVRHAGWTLAFAVLLAGYFRLRLRAFSPALSDARLQALQARIRPHFLFNSINAVLLLMRRDPKRAETALEDLAELFRSLMADHRSLTSFGEEVALTRRYLELEQLRLGERLAVDWRVDPAAEAASVPPLLLQPLVENAVYHGIEPGMEVGRVDIHARRDGEQLRIVISNPYHPDYQHHQGNRMALTNIRERLQLHFDVDAELGTEVADGRFFIRMRLPFRRFKTAPGGLS
jgi:two-component system sensor histidine kinase AlgZ